MHIELHRTFREMLPKEQVDDSRSLYAGNATLKLRELLDELRVVILSEGGSGKTHEIREAARLLREENKQAFFVRLEHVVSDFESAFLVGSLAEFQSWLASGEPGWLLLDSVDESRLRSPMDFESAIRKVARVVSSAKQRTHLLLTGRTAAWRPKTDLELCTSLFPILNERTSGGEDASLSRKTEMGKPEELPFKVVTLEELTPDQIKVFASAKGVVDTKACCCSQAVMRFARDVPNKWAGLIARFFGRAYAASICCFAINLRPSKLRWVYFPQDFGCRVFSLPG